MQTATRPLSGDQSRPMTGIKGAGFTSRPDSLGVSPNTNPLLQALTAEALFKQTPTPNEESDTLERQTHDLVERSTVLALTDPAEAVKLAVSALKCCTKLDKLRKQHNIPDPTANGTRFLVLFNLAICTEQNGQLAQALNIYKKMLPEFSNSPNATRVRVNMGNIFFKQKQYGEAIKNYRMGADNVTDKNVLYRHRIRRNVAFSYLIQQQYEKAMEEYEKMNEEHADLPSAFNLLLCYRAMGNEQLMLKGFSRLLAVDKEERKLLFGGLRRKTDEFGIDDELDGSFNASGTLGLSGLDATTGSANNPFGSGLDYLLNGGVQNDDQPKQKDELAKEMQRRIERSHRYILQAARVIIPVLSADIMSSYDHIAEILRQEGYSSIASQIDMAKATECLQRGDIDEAQEMLTSFTKQGGQIAGDAHLNLAFLLLARNEPEQAEQHTSQALKLAPFSAQALVAMGNTRYAQGKYDEAVTLYNRALQNDPSSVEAEYNCGLALKETKKFDQALVHFSKLNKRYPENNEVLAMMALIELERHNAQNSLRLLTTISARVPTDAALWAKIGSLQVELKDESAALHSYQESFRADPSSLEVCIWIGYHYVKNYQFEHAAPYFEQAIRIKPIANYYILLSSCYTKMEEKERALATYELAHQKFPNDVKVLKYLVSACNQVGKADLAQKYQQKLTALEEKQGAIDASSSAASASRPTQGEPISPQRPAARGRGKVRGRGRGKSRGAKSRPVSGAAGAAPPSSFGMGGGVAAPSIAPPVSASRAQPPPQNRQMGGGGASAAGRQDDIDFGDDRGDELLP